MKLISNVERKRLITIADFLKSENIPLTSLIKIKGDASFRKYYRIKNTNHILMDADPKTNEKISSFIKIQKILSEYTINVPKIYKKDVSLGLMIIEDLGKKRFLDYKNNSKTRRDLYANCKSVLSKIHYKSIEMPDKIKNIKKYTINEQMKETDLFFSWYLKKHLNKTISRREKDAFKKIFKKIYKNLNIKNYCLVLRDFHVDNIIPIPEIDYLTGKEILNNSKVPNLGLIDFQDALVGSPAYDFCSLIEDVRAPLNEIEKKNAISKYVIKFKANLKRNMRKLENNKRTSAKSNHKDIYKKKFEDVSILSEVNSTVYQELSNFKTKISYFSIQRNLKILGIFCRLKYRDKKSNYIKYLPQAKKFIRENLKNPEFNELKGWFYKNKINV